MFQFRGFPSYTYVFSIWYTVLHRMCFHIQKSADRSLFAAPRSLSQLVTSFFGSWCQGILLVLLFAWTSFASIYFRISRSLRSLFKNCWVTFNSFWFSYFSPSFHNYLCFDLAKLYFVTLNFKLYLERPNWFQFMSSSLNFFFSEILSVFSCSH